MHRATHVCVTCKSSKKACDKALPRCGSCARRGLPCSYAEPRQGEKVATHTDHDSLLGLCQILEWPASKNSVDTVLYFHLCKILRQTDLSVSRLGEHYFRDFHRHLPIICPSLFRGTVATYRGTSPPADFTILLLALCLLAWNPSNNSRLQRNPDLLKRIHVTSKVLFARIQAVVSSSIPLIQASTVIAAFEHASGHPRAANITLGTSARMISSIEPSIHLNQDMSSIPPDRNIRLKAREASNLWWSVATFERIVLCDIPNCKQALILQFPDQNSPLPPDLPPAQDHSESIHFPPAPSLSDLDAPSISGFGRQIQVTYLLDRLLGTLTRPITNREHHIVALQSLDQGIQRILSVLIRDCDHEWRHYCGAIGTATRTLFLLHEHIRTLHPNTSNIKWVQRGSLAGLRFVTKVMVDVARDHLQRVNAVNAGALPLSCAYNLRAAIRNIDAEPRGEKGDGYNARKEGLAALLALDNICCQRWCKEPYSRRS